ncbi:MAG: PEP-CTERM sorting domain-containing protein [Candidatus Tectimicrobiota bacterium]
MTRFLVKTRVGMVMMGWVAVIVLLCAPAAMAVPINITVDAAGNLLHGVGVADEAQYGQPNNNPSSNLAFLMNEINNWNGVPLAPVLPAADPLELNQDSLGGGSSYSGPSGYEYVVFHFGAGQAGGGGVSRGGYWSAYYLAGDAITLAALPQINGESVGGFSSARYYGIHDDNGGGGGGGGSQVPEPSTMFLLGSGLLAGAIASWKKRAAKK